MTPAQRRANRDRAIMYGTGGLVTLVAGCYGWSPVVSALTGLAVGLVVGWGLDGRPQ